MSILEITNERIKEIAERYGLEASHSENKEEAGFYIGDKKVELGDIFPEIKNI